MGGIWWYLRGFKKVLWDFFAPMFLLTVKQGCQTIVHAATVENLPSGPVYYTPYKQKKWCPYHSDTIGFYNGPTLGSPDPKVYREDQWSKLWDSLRNRSNHFCEQLHTAATSHCIQRR